MKGLNILFLAVLLIGSFSIPDQMLPLRPQEFEAVSSNVINVTVGEQFSLPLPQFDSGWSNDHFKAYQL